MKVRIGYGLGASAAADDAEGFAELVDALEARGFDSLWLSERVSGDAARPDDRASRSRPAGPRKLKLGTSVQVLPGPQPGAARQGVGEPRRALRRPAAPGVRPRRRRTRPSSRRSASTRDERRRGSTRRCRSCGGCWTEDAVDHDGPRFHYEASRSCRSRCSSRPTCGSAAGRRASCDASAASATAGSRASRPRRFAAGRVVIEEAAADAGPRDRRRALRRAGDLRARRDPRPLAAGIKARRPDVDPGELVPVGFARCGRASSSSSSTASRSWSSCPCTTRGHGPPSSTTPPARSFRLQT